MLRFILFTSLLLTFFGTTAFSQTDALPACSDDSLLFNKKTELLRNSWSEGITPLLVEAAMGFMGTPYIGRTLEGNSSESLVVNLHELDCSTFLESCLAIVLSVKKGDGTYSDFKNNLRTIRYRKGIIDGYESRLHYFSDWIFDNQQKGIIEDITNKSGGIPYPKEINFMSTHYGSYAQLANNPVLVEKISMIEKEISTREYYFIPKDSVVLVEPWLKEGMIVAITSGITGLDIAHVGFLVKVNDRIHLLHASSDAGKVVLSDKPLSEYLAGNKKQTGIMVLNVCE